MSLGSRSGGMPSSGGSRFEVANGAALGSSVFAALDSLVFAATGADALEQPSSAIAVNTTSASAVGVKTGLGIRNLDGRGNTTIVRPAGSSINSFAQPDLPVQCSSVHKRVAADGAFPAFLLRGEEHLDVHDRELANPGRRQRVNQFSRRAAGDVDGRAEHFSAGHTL